MGGNPSSYLLQAEPVDRARVPPAQTGRGEGPGDRRREIDPDGIDWIWEPYLPAGAVTLMAGAPGCGKSFLSIALAAELSRGLTPFHRKPDR